MHRGQIARKSFQRRTEHTREHIDRERKRSDGQRQPGHRNVLEFVVMSEADLAQQIEAQQCEHDDPDRQINLAVEQPPVVGLVGHTQELETEGDLDKTENDLHGTEPTAALGQVFQQGGEESENRKRQGKSQRESEHRHDRHPEFAGSRTNQDVADDRPGAGERHQHQRQSHEEDTDQTAFVRVPVALIDHPARKRDLEGPEERCGENHEHDEEDQVGKPVRSQPVENVGRHGIAAHQTRNQNDRRNGKRIERYDEETVHRSLETSRSRRSAAFHKERYGHRDHREYTRSEQRREAPKNRFDNQTPQGFGLSGSVAGNRLIRSIPGRNGCPGRLGIADRDLESPILGRIAIFLLAGTPVDIAFQYGALTRQGDFLTEDDFIEISTHFDLENIVVFAFGSVDLIRIAVERQARCRLELHQGRRNVRMQVVRMPSRQDLTRKYDFVIRIAEVLQSAVPGNGRGLRVSRQQTRQESRQQHDTDIKFHISVVLSLPHKDSKFYSKTTYGTHYLASARKNYSETFPSASALLRAKDCKARYSLSP